MRNYKGEGKIQNFVAPAGGVISGTLALVQGTVCMPITTAAAGATFAAYVTGKLSGLTKAAGTTATAGARAYWSSATGLVEATDTATNRLIGNFDANAVNGQTTCDVNLILPVGGDANADVAAKANKIVPAADHNIATLALATGDLEDGGTMAAAIAAGGGVTEVAVAAGANFLMISTGANRVIDDSTILITNVPTMAANGSAGNLVGTAAADKALSDSGVVIANVVTQAAAAAALDRIPTYTGATKILQDSGRLLANVPSMAANGVAGNLVQTAGADKALSDAGVAITNLATMAAVGGAGNLLQTVAADRAVSDAGIPVANVPTMAAVGGAGNLVQTAAASRAQSDAGIPVANVPTMAAVAASAGLIITSGGADKTQVATTLSQFPAVEAADHNASAVLSMVAEGCVGVIRFSKEVADAADIQLTLPAGYNIRVLDAWAVKTNGNGAAGDTVQIMNGGAGITNAISLNVVDTTVVRAGTIDDAQHRVAGGALLVADFTLGGGGDTRSKVYVSYLRVA